VLDFEDTNKRLCKFTVVSVENWWVCFIRCLCFIGWVSFQFCSIIVL